MHIKIISDEKLKVTLSAVDLERYGIRIEDIDYDTTETRRVFWTILDQAKLETGFNAKLVSPRISFTVADVVILAPVCENLNTRAPLV